ncbi:hypothetical protein D3C81_1341170 [compost metagenome]
MNAWPGPQRNGAILLAGAGIYCSRHETLSCPVQQHRASGSILLNLGPVQFLKQMSR